MITSRPEIAPETESGDLKTVEADRREPMPSPSILAAPTPASFRDAPAFSLSRHLTPLAHDLIDGEHGHSQVAKGSIWFVGSVVIGAAFSLLFWTMAAHLVDNSIVNDGTRFMTMANGVNFITGMGLAVAVARFGSGKPKTVWVLYLWALIYTSAASAVGVLIFSVAAPSFVPSGYLDPLFQWGTAVGILLFLVIVNGMSFAILVEVRLVTMRRWRWVMGRVLAVSLVRMPFLFVPEIAGNPVGLLVLINGIPALSGYLGVVGLWISTPRRERAPLFPLPAEIVPAFRFANVNYLGMLAAQAPQFFIPIVAIAAVPKDDYGAFFYAWQITLVVFLVPHVIGQVVLSEGSRRKNSVPKQVRTGLRMALALTIVATIGAWLAAKSGLVTMVFGKDYELTADLLPRFVAAGIPWSITSICLARARVGEAHVRTILITAGFAVFTIVPTIVMTSRSGTNGGANAWLLGNVLAAATAVAVTYWVGSSPKTHLVTSDAHAGAA